jgi:hypothetical protein
MAETRLQFALSEIRSFNFGGGSALHGKIADLSENFRVLHDHLRIAEYRLTRDGLGQSSITSATSNLFNHLVTSVVPETKDDEEVFGKDTFRSRTLAFQRLAEHGAHKLSSGLINDRTTLRDKGNNAVRSTLQTVALFFDRSVEPQRNVLIATHPITEFVTAVKEIEGSARSAEVTLPPHMSAAFGSFRNAVQLARATVTGINLTWKQSNFDVFLPEAAKFFSAAEKDLRLIVASLKNEKAPQRGKAVHPAVRGLTAG